MPTGTIIHGCGIVDVPFCDNRGNVQYTLRAMVDTGSRFDVIVESTFMTALKARNLVHPTPGGASIRQMNGGTVPAFTYDAYVSWVSLQPVQLLEPVAGPYLGQPPAPAIIIGGRLLSGFKVVFDYPNAEVTIS